MRPVLHLALANLRAYPHHRAVSLLIEAVAGRTCEDTWCSIRDDMRRIKIGHLRSPLEKARSVCTRGGSAIRVRTNCQSQVTSRGKYATSLA